MHNNVFIAGFLEKFSGGVVPRCFYDSGYGFQQSSTKHAGHSSNSAINIVGGVILELLLFRTATDKSMYCSLLEKEPLLIVLSLSLFRRTRFPHVDLSPWLSSHSTFKARHELMYDMVQRFSSVGPPARSDQGRETRPVCPQIRWRTEASPLPHLRRTPSPPASRASPTAWRLTVTR